MSTPSFDPVQYKARQRQLWDTVAPGWKKWWPTQERAARHVSDRLVELAEIRPGYRVLDVGTGIGEPALTAAQRVGAAGHVIATDHAPQMLAIANERAMGLGLQNVEFRDMDTEAIEFPDSSFDAILSRFSLMSLPDLATALARIRRMLRPNGLFATAVWDIASKVPFSSLAFELARTTFHLPPPPPGTPSAYGLAEGKLEATLTHAGFTDIRTEILPVVFEYESAEAFIQYTREISAQLLAMLATQPAERQAEYWQRLGETMQQYATADGSIRIPNTAICGVGRR